METLYTAQKVEDTETGWLISENETGEKFLVFCKVDANTPEDALNLVDDVKQNNKEKSE